MGKFKNHQRYALRVVAVNTLTTVAAPQADGSTVFLPTEEGVQPEIAVLVEPIISRPGKTITLGAPVDMRQISPRTGKVRRPLWIKLGSARSRQ